MIRVHRFESSADAYDACQCDESIKDGDVLIVESERVAGFLFRAWPVAVTEEHGAFHTLTADSDLSCLGKAEGRTFEYIVHPNDGDPYPHTEVIPADPGDDYRASAWIALKRAEYLGFEVAV